MCGILVQYSKTKVNIDRFKEALMLWSHRGPDNQSVLKICKSLVFGHTRLSIVDLSNKSNQPMSNDNYFWV